MWQSSKFAINVLVSIYKDDYQTTQHTHPSQYFAQIFYNIKTYKLTSQDGKDLLSDSFPSDFSSPKPHSIIFLNKRCKQKQTNKNRKSSYWSLADNCDKISFLRKFRKLRKLAKFFASCSSESLWILAFSALSLKLTLCSSYSGSNKNVCVHAEKCQKLSNSWNINVKIF